MLLINPLPIISDKLKALGVALLVGAIFFLGWISSKRYYKQEPTVITKTITVKVGNPDQTPTAPIVDHGVVKPGTNYVDSKEQPKQPDGSTLPPISKPDSTTTITVEVPTPMKLQVFHQTKLLWARKGDTYNIWDESRVWTRDEKGNALPGVTAETTYSKDAELSLPVSFTVPLAKEHPWSVGALVKVSPARGYGVYVDRDFGPIRTGVQVVKSADSLYWKGSTDTTLKVGWVF